AGLQELCFSIDDGFRELSYKLDLQNETLQAIKEILERPLNTQARELRKRAEFAYMNSWMDEAEVDLLESEKKNYQDFIALHILGNIYYYYKKNNQKALEYYQKSAKYAAPQSKNDACTALIYAARVFYELGKLDDAYKSTGLAMSMLSDDTHILFNHAAYAAITGHPDESIDCLRKAVLKDPNFLIAADKDERFFSVKQEKENLKRNLRDEQRQVVEQQRQTVNFVRQKISSARNEVENLGITDLTFSLEKELAALDKGITEIDRLYNNNSYFDFLKAEEMALKAKDIAQNNYEHSLGKWIKVKELCLHELTTAENEIQRKSVWAIGGSFVLSYFLYWMLIPYAIVSKIKKTKKINTLKGEIAIENNAIARLEKLKNK
ncbi:MAG: hypothetical protein QME64_10590, partial [bacterium]|nr:hypothetical protein [bacterium]